MNNGRPPRIHVVPDSTQPGADFEDDTAPDVRGVSNAVLYRLLKKLNGRMTGVIVAIVLQAAAMALCALLYYWSRG